MLPNPCLEETHTVSPWYLEFNSITARSNSRRLQEVDSFFLENCLSFVFYTVCATLARLPHFPEDFFLPWNPTWTFLERYVQSLYGMLMWSCSIIALRSSNCQALLGVTGIKNDSRDASLTSRCSLAKNYTHS